ncbi:phosphatase PAP2 family protein [Bradyrhizobium sp. IC3069]|uniref:phosphatase PAP2 family protein n=1 Tax=unclassified Bradyrhizobium TaxID=2631580 RepID=UPI001CD6CA89|nr:MULTISPECIES: phosphatase PAP2 family protein [unclassified Bradyrhizobium]MCA1364987.1 phosphatase PAP2 family protein [Bradyrhizobium sp. IC4059]MCA1522651.1 phosphatase PAP2 family protein [Bradyrhizobium sp. IC3069]
MTEQSDEALPQSPLNAPLEPLPFDPSLSLLRLNWTLISALAAIFGAGVLLTDFNIKWNGYLTVGGVAAVYGLVGHLNAKSSTASPRVYATLLLPAQTVLFLILLVSLGYIAASANLPMQESRLLAFDRMLGLDFRAYVHFVDERPALLHAFALTYDSINQQMLLLVILLPLFGFHQRGTEFVLGLAVALIGTTFISTLVPATGAYEAAGLHPSDYPNFEPVCYYATLRELPLIREGVTRVIDVYALAPVLTFPSFHAVLAVLYVWAIWPIWWLRIPGALWNAVMLAATPIGGGHFFADVIAGAAIALLTIVAVHRLGRRLSRDQKMVKPVLLPLTSTAAVHA